MANNTAIQVFGEINSGAAVLYYGNIFTKSTSVITTQVDQASSPAGYTATATAIAVDAGDGGVIAPNVPDLDSAESVADPPVLDIICVVDTGEIMACYSRETDTLNVIRGISKLQELRKTSDTQFNLAIEDDDYLQFMGTGSFPTARSLIVTNGDVAVNKTQGMFQTRDNVLGKGEAYTSEPPNIEVTFTVPRSTMPAERYSEFSISNQTDGNSPAKYIEHFDQYSAGTELPSKFFIVVPVSQHKAKDTVTVGGSNHLDLAKCIIIPKGYVSVENQRTYSEGAQTEIAMTIVGGTDDTWRTMGWLGAFSDMCRMAEIVS